MPKLPNIELIEEKILNVKKDVAHAQQSVDELEETVKKEYTPLSTTRQIEKDVDKFKNLWDWAMKIILGAMLVGILALLGLAGAR